jgi:peptide/nickel transport system substrate-binding protein
MSRLNGFHGRRTVRVLAALTFVPLLAWAPAALAGKPSAAAGAKSGGSITVQLDGPPECLDSAKQGTGYDYDVNYGVEDTLVSLNERGKPVPYLAQSYNVTSGGKTITFNLRHDVKFSNGDPLTAAAVKTDFERILNPTTKSPVSKGLLGPITSITTSGKYVVKLNFSQPYRPVLGNLGNDYLGIMDPKSVTAAGGNACNTGLVGTGPFKITSVGPAFASVKVVRNSAHTFGPSWAHNKGPGYLSSITYVPITSNTTAVSELLSGQVDIADIQGDQLSRVTGNKNIVLHRVLGQAEAYLQFNLGRAPFNNIAVRRAVDEAINRTAVITAALNGLGKVSTSFLPPTIFDYDPGSAQYAPKLNLAAAQRAIATAHATGPYTLLTTNVLGLDSAAELIQGELAQVGMQVNIVTKSVPDWEAQLGKEDFDMGMIGYGYYDPDAMYLFFNSSQRNGGLDWMNYTDPTLDKLVAAGRSTLNLKKAKADYYAAQKLLDTKAYIDPLWVPITVTGVRSRVQGWHINVSDTEVWQDFWVK